MLWKLTLKNKFCLKIIIMHIFSAQSDCWLRNDWQKSLSLQLQLLRKATSPVWQGRFYVPACRHLVPVFSCQPLWIDRDRFCVSQIPKNTQAANARVTKVATLQINNKTERVPNLDGDQNYISEVSISFNYRSRVWLVFRASAELHQRCSKYVHNTGSQRLKF